MIPKVIEISDRQADNETERERVWDEGSVGSLVKQDKEADVLAWLFTAEKKKKNPKSAWQKAPVFLDALFYTNILVAHAARSDFSVQWQLLCSVTPMRYDGARKHRNTAITDDDGCLE